MAARIRLAPSPERIALLETGTVPRPFAVTNNDIGHWIADTQLGHNGTIPAAEDPHDTAARNSLVGKAVEFDEEIVLEGKDFVRRRNVVRREDPVEFGPILRWEERGAEGRKVLKGRLSEQRRSCPDEAERKIREKLGVGGGSHPDKVFKLRS